MTGRFAILCLSASHTFLFRSDGSPRREPSGRDPMAKQEASESSGHAGKLKLCDGRSVTLRSMRAADKQRILSFAQALPPDDLLFLRTDITEPALWLTNGSEILKRARR